MSFSIIDNAKLYFPLLVERGAEFCEVGNFELIIRMNNGDKFLYDDLDRSIRQLPKDSLNMTEEECKREFGMRLYKVMERKRVTQKELAELTGIHQSLISRYITGASEPSFYKVDKIAKALCCSTDDLRYY